MKKAKSSKSIFFVILAILVAFAIFGFVLSIRFFTNPNASMSSMYNIGVDVLGLFVCAVLFFGCLGDFDNLLSNSNAAFVTLLILNELAFFNNEICWFISGNAEYNTVYLILNSITKIIDFLLVLLFYRYVSSYMHFEGKTAKKIGTFVQIMLIPAVLLIIFNGFFGFCFYINENAEFVRTPLYTLVDLYLVFVVPPTLYLVHKSKGSRNRKIVSYIFIAIPIIHYAFTGGAHGYATQYGSTLVALIILYARIFNDRSKVLFATKNELNLATQIQKAMVPNTFPPYPDRDEFDLYAYMNPAKEVGGDFYDYCMVDEDHICLVIADVSDKGVPAALFMMVAKTIIQSCVMLGKSAAETLEKANNAICFNNPYGMFVTVWLGILEISTGKMSAANAGHEYPVVMRKGEDYELVKDKHGLFVGGLKGSTYTEYDLKLEPGTRLFVYTDGVPEAKNSNKEMFGVKRMVEVLNKDKSAGPEQVIKNIRSAVDDFVGGAEQFDDLTMLCIEYKGKKN